jgi:small subunit ribosomal protein S10
MLQKSNLNMIIKQSKVHLKIKSFHPKLFEKALNKILNKVTALNLKISKSISLPTKIQRYTVLRSPHIDKKSREQFEIRHYKFKFKYNNLINDLIDYSQEFAGSTENLPWSIKDFLHDMISNGIGRFDKLGYIRFDEKMLTDYEPKNFFEVFKTNF